MKCIVTAEDIRAAQAARETTSYMPSKACAVARAMQRALGDNTTRTGYNYAYTSPYRWQLDALSTGGLIAWMREFDETGRGEPFEFEFTLEPTPELDL